MITWIKSVFGKSRNLASSTETVRVSLELPKLLSQLIEQGTWPQAGANVNEQEFEPIIDSGIVNKIFPGEDRVSLMPPPFHTIADEKYDEHDFWKTGVSNYVEIEYSKALIIADFGVGSDSPIVLYYGSENEPDIRFLKWLGNGSSITHKWIRSHGSFEEFANEVGLIK
jgi:hypothetical protein